MMPSAAIWFELFVNLAIGVAVVVLATALAARRLTRSAWQRALWQACTLGLALLCLFELAGLNRRLAGALQMSMGDSPRTDSLPSQAPARELERACEKEKPATIVPLLKAENTQEPMPSSPVDPQANKAETHRQAKRRDGETAIRATSVADSPVRPFAVSAPWWPGIIWVLGTGLVAGRSAIARVLLVIFRFRHPALRDAEFLAKLDSLARRLGIPGQVRVIEGSGLMTPFTFGVFRPTIALPATFVEEFDSSRQEAMLAHELAHVAGRDPAWLLAADLMTAALWWHPLAWWCRHQLQAAGEAAADEACLLVTDGPAVLAACLVELAGRLVKSRQVGGASVAGNGFRSSLGRRVERLLRLNGQTWNRPGRFRSLSVWIAAIPILLVAATLATAWARPQGLLKGDDPMTSWQSSWNRSVAGMVLCTILAPATDTVVAQDPPKPAPDKPPIERKAGDTLPALDKSNAVPAPSSSAPTEKISPDTTSSAASGSEAKPAPQRIKIFRLTYLQPREMLQLFQGFTPVFEGGAQGQPLPLSTFIQAARVAEGGSGASAGNMAEMMLKMRSTTARSGSGSAGTARPLFSMATNVTNVSGQGPPCYFAIDERTRSLIARGTEKDLQAVAEFVALLDLPPNKPIPKLKNLHAFKLRFANPGNVAEVLKALNIDVLVAFIPKSTILLLNGPEAAIKEATEIIEALDAEVKGAETKPPETAPTGETLKDIKEPSGRN